MNASNITTSIARGFAIYAEFMNMPEHGPDFARCAKRWYGWRAAHPKLWQYVTELHAQAFDDVLRFEDVL